MELGKGEPVTGEHVGAGSNLSLGSRVVPL